MGEDSTPVKPGDVLAGKYRVERVLGMGGMGVVVAATHLDLGSRVALKFLLPSALANAAAVGRFAQEARAVVRLRSEHVARVTDVGRLESGAPYIVMEYLEGTDLGARLEQLGPLPVADAVDYVLQACEAVAEAHAFGIVHRDLKPRNLFLTSGVDGRPLVKVLDFGISKLGGATASQSIEQMSLTKTSDIMGSPMYMSPEQLRSSRRVDERSDIWSLGVILYELLTARVPFEAESVTELCAMLLQDPHVPVAQLRPEIPPGVTAAIDRCLQKDAAARFQSVAELAGALEAYGPPGAKEMAERVRLVGLSVAAARTSNLPESATSGPPEPRAMSSGSMPLGSSVSAPPSAQVPSSRVAVTGGTSVSWGETQLASLVAPRRSNRARWALGAAGAVGAVVVVGAALFAWSSSRPVAGVAPTASTQGASAAAIASRDTPGAITTSTSTPTPTSIPSPPPTPPPTALPTQPRTHSTRVTVARPVTTSTRPAASTTSVAATHPTTPGPTHKSDDLPNERE